MTPFAVINWHCCSSKSHINIKRAFLHVLKWNNSKNKLKRLFWLDMWWYVFQSLVRNPSLWLQVRFFNRGENKNAQKMIAEFSSLSLEDLSATNVWVLLWNKRKDIKNDVWAAALTWGSSSRPQAESRGWQWKPKLIGRSKGRGKAVLPSRHSTALSKSLCSPAGKTTQIKTAVKHDGIRSIISRCSSHYLVEAPAVEERHQLMEVAFCGVEYLLNLPEGFLHVTQKSENVKTEGEKGQVRC